MPSTPKLLLLTTNDSHWVWLNEVCADKFLVVKESGNFQSVAQRVNLVAPQLGIVDFTAQADFDPQTVVDQLRTIEPRLPILALGRKSTAEMVMIALRSGARDFIDIEASHADAINTFSHVLERSEAPVKQQEGHAIVVLGARAGVGATTFSVNLAAQLKKQTGVETLMLDFGLPLGDGLIHLPCDEKQGSMDFVECVRNLRRFDSNLARTAFRRNADSGVALLSLPKNVSDLREISSQDALKFLNLIKSFFGNVVVDLCGFSNNDFVANLLYTADTIVMMTDQCVPKVVSCSELMKALNDRGVTPDRINLLVNQYDPALALSAASIASKLNAKRFFTLPSRRSSLISAVNLGKVLSLADPRDPYSKGIESLATELGLLGQAAPVSLLDKIKQWRKA